MNTQFTVLSCTQSKDGSQKFCVKMQNQSAISVTTPLGEVTKDSQVTYYLFTNKATPIGTKVNMDIDALGLKVIESPYDLVDESTGEITTVMLKYLVPKV